jgi:predicted RNase H-like nuclease (RuvC/YqgF family)
MNETVKDPTGRIKQTRVEELENEVKYLKTELKESEAMIEALQAACAGRLG